MCLCIQYTFYENECTVWLDVYWKQEHIFAVDSSKTLLNQRITGEVLIGIRIVIKLHLSDRGEVYKLFYSSSLKSDQLWKMLILLAEVFYLEWISRVGFGNWIADFQGILVSRTSRSSVCDSLGSHGSLGLDSTDQKWRSIRKGKIYTHRGICHVIGW